MLSRRSVLIAGLAVAGGAWGQGAAPAASCGKPTERQTAGPFFKSNSPRRDSLIETGSSAPVLVVTGLVQSIECKPVAGALLDFWQADEFGEYDNKGFRYRGHQFTDAQGRWRLETVFPAEYPGRSRHLHVNVQVPGKRMLTTQLYFPGDRRDGLYRDSLAIRVDGKDGKRIEGSFNFVVEA